MRPSAAVLGAATVATVSATGRVSPSAHWWKVTFSVSRSSRWNLVRIGGTAARTTATATSSGASASAIGIDQLPSLAQSAQPAHDRVHDLSRNVERDVPRLV